jgi:pimeloyl-ACP methyl ester carboxylesterase
MLSLLLTAVALPIDGVTTAPPARPAMADAVARPLPQRNADSSLDDLFEPETFDANGASRARLHSQLDDTPFQPATFDDNAMSAATWRPYIVANFSTQLLAEGPFGRDQATVYYPLWTGNFQLPLIVLLGGLASPGSNYGAVASKIAATGYVVVSPNHLRKIPQTDAEGNIQGFVAIPAPEPSVISDAVNSMTALTEDSSSALYRKVDFDRIGLFGHSTGGGAAIAAVSETPANCFYPLCSGDNLQSQLNYGGFPPELLPEGAPTFPNNLPATYQAPAGIKAVVTYGALYPEAFPLLPALTFPNPDTTQTPTFQLQGELDTVPGTDTASTAPGLFERLDGTKGYIVFEGLNHVAVTDVPGPLMFDSPMTKSLEYAHNAIAFFAVRIFDAHVKESRFQSRQLCKQRTWPIQGVEIVGLEDEDC